jgi:tetraacyldisaccharide 4'-kinase
VRLREWVVVWWGGGGGGVGELLRWFTRPLEWGFGKGSGLRNSLYDGGILPLQRIPIPVISVGNLTVGGSGKTPFSAWLLRELRARGEKPALVARGYGQDEMTLHRRWNPDCLVLAEEDRAFGAWKSAKKGASVVVLDDGFQHRRLSRQLDIVLVAAATPERVRLLPRGPFREPFSALNRAGVVVLTQKGLSESSVEVEMQVEPFLREAPVRVAFTPQGWLGPDGKAAPGPEGDYLAVCGIGDPLGFSRILGEATGRSGELLSYPDHHDYSWTDVMAIRERLRGRTLVTTEKDAVKLSAYQQDLPGFRVLKMGLEFLDGEARLWRHVEGVLEGIGGAS